MPNNTKGKERHTSKRFNIKEGQVVGNFRMITFVETVSRVDNRSNKKLRYFPIWITECLNCGWRENRQVPHMTALNRRCKHCMGLPKGHSGFTQLWCDYKSNKRGRQFELSKEQFRTLITSDCHYCGQPPMNKRLPKSSHKWGEFTYNGIDRIDNTIGYVVGNCVPCCSFCNYAKREKGYDEFTQWINRIKQPSLL